MLRQQKFLNNVLERLNDEIGQKEVISEIESVREVLTNPKNMITYVATNVDKLTAQVPNVYDPWNTYFSTFDTPSKTKLVHFYKYKLQIAYTYINYKHIII